MRIVCPSCDAAYEVPRSLLGDGDQMVRCARCGKEWLPEPVTLPGGPPLVPPTLATLHNPAEPPAPAPVSIEDVNAFVSTRHAQGLDAERDAAAVAAQPVEQLPPSARFRLLTGLAWLASLAIFAGGAALLYLRRAEIQSAWPNAIRLYRLLGLE